MSSRACRRLCRVTLSFLIVLALSDALARAQSISEYAVPSPPPTDLLTITAGPDGAVWFGESRTSKIGRVAPDGTITEYSTTVGKPPYSLVTGPDGNLWFADGGDVGRMTPTGQVTFFPVGPSGGIGAEPVAIAAGPQGALWTACQGTHELAKVTTDGTVTQFPVPVGDPNSSTPYAIAAGPDGNLWYPDDDGDFIGRMTPTGTVQTFPVPAGTRPQAITAGPDGAMWFSNYTGGLGRISTSGQVQIFPFGANAHALTVGSDGNIWLVDISGLVGRVTPAGVATVYPLPDRTVVPAAITGGPDGGIWFTESHANKIARASTAGIGASLCTPDAHTLCLNSGRFSATVQFQSTAGGPILDATAVPLTDATGYFWFFDSGNVELIVKVLNGCGGNGAYWLFAAGLTNVGVHLVVNDLTRGQQQMWDNAVGTAFAPIQDTAAFHTCP